MSAGFRKKEEHSFLETAPSEGKDEPLLPPENAIP